ncbi:hypothetical protein DID88_001134 [Monilinia fructigena]|uniref:Uncharacterized protein n=1 Tax=Monilinia fructigena TaxID=38457 RepID=A0A395IYE3_9HELO|nr:hypothetical protein DID88_001134 [Monilinia fructigena]
MATIASFKIPKVVNEPNHHYAKGSAQRDGLYKALGRLESKAPLEVPLVIGGKEIKNFLHLSPAQPSRPLLESRILFQCVPL